MGTGHGTVFYEDSLGELDGIALGARQVSSVVRFELSQPKVIRDISTSIQIFDEPRLLGAVTRQLFDFQSGTATLSVVLSMAAPLRTLAVSSLTAPTGISIAPLGIADNALCADNRTLTCQQTYNFELDPQGLKHHCQSLSHWIVKIFVQLCKVFFLLMVQSLLMANLMLFRLLKARFCLLKLKTKLEFVKHSTIVKLVVQHQ